MRCDFLTVARDQETGASVGQQCHKEPAPDSRWPIFENHHPAGQQARDGTIRVLRAASEAGVRRTALTSSFAAAGYGHPARREPFTETDWTDVTQPDVHAYIRLKTEAELAAWELLSGDDIGMELSAINPVGIFGPVLGPDFSSSVEIIRSLLRGSIPATPRMYFGMVDARDVAALHLTAMTSPAAGNIRLAGSDKAPQKLRWNPRSNEELIVATAESLLRHGLVSD